MEDSSNKIPSLVETAGSITESFKKLKFVTLACIAGIVITAIGCNIFGYLKFNELKSQVYVIDHGQSFSATAQDRTITLQDRIEFQARNLHKLLFTISPNRELVQKNVNEALGFSDRSVYRYYQDLNERRFYARMYQNGAYQDIQVDSVKYDLSRRPYLVVTYATLLTMRESNIQRSSLISRCNMIEVDMEKKNREGLKVENFEVLKNEIIETRKR